MAVVRDQVATTLSGASPTTLTLAWGTNPVAGAKAFVQVALAGAGTITSVVDNGTSPTTFTLDVSGSSTVFLYRGDNITLPGAGSYHVTITITGASGVDYHAGGATFTGLATGGPTSSTGAGTGTSNSVNTGNLTPVTIGDLKVGGFADGGGTQTISLTTSGAQVVFSQTNGNTALAGGMANHVTTASGAQALAWTITTTPLWATAYAVYAQTTGTTVTAGLAAGTGAALQPAGHNAGLAAGTGTAQQPLSLVTATPTVAHGAGTAGQPVVVTGTIVTAVLAHATGAAQQPVTSIAFTAALAHGAGTTSAIAVPTATPTVAHGTGTAQSPSKTVMPKAVLANAQAPALAPVIKLLRHPLNLGASLVLPSPDALVTVPAIDGSFTVRTIAATLVIPTIDSTVTGWTMQVAPINLLEFNDVTIDFAVTSSGSPLNLTGATVNLLFKAQAGDPDVSALIFSSGGVGPAITITSPTGGLCTATIPDADLNSEIYFFYRLDVVSAGLINTAVSGPITWTSL